MNEPKALFVERFTHTAFRQGFRAYFQELGISVEDWEGLFQEMDQDGRGNRAYLLLEGDRAAGLIQFCPVQLECWFFTQRAGFVRELWVAPDRRGRGYGARLLELAETWLRENGAALVLLTTDTAPGFYEKRGYHRDRSIAAKNDDPVYKKSL